MAKLSAHFDTDEPGVQCKCGCGFGSRKYDTAPELWRVLEQIREYFGRPIYFTSVARCAKHNRAAGGARSSQHLLGNAADFSIPGVSPLKIADFCDRTWPTKYGVGRYQGFTHIDVRRHKSRWFG